MAPRSLLPPETVAEVDLTKIVRVADNDQDYDDNDLMIISNMATNNHHQNYQHDYDDNDQDYDDNDHHDHLQFGHLPLFSFVQLEEFSASALAHLIIMIIKTMIIKSMIIKIVIIKVMMIAMMMIISMVNFLTQDSSTKLPRQSGPIENNHQSILKTFRAA